jgi:predicted 2-oxoglutarate/Fe(II)-dependent dioxygenase YbiX
VQLKELSSGLCTVQSLLDVEEIIEYVNDSSRLERWNRSTFFSEDNIRVADKSMRSSFSFALSQKLDKELYRTILNDVDEKLSAYCEKFLIILRKGEAFQILKYEVGDFYTSHIDQVSVDTHRSVSIILYLNENFTGGVLRFPFQRIEITPRSGLLVLFPSNFMYRHEALPVKSGVKYSLVSWASM